MAWTMCSLENLQVKVLSRVVVVFTWANVFMCINILFVKSYNFTRTYSHLENFHGEFYYEIVPFFQVLLVYMLAVLLGDDLLLIMIIKYSYSASILCRFQNVLCVFIKFFRYLVRAGLVEKNYVI